MKIHTRRLLAPLSQPLARLSFAATVIRARHPLRPRISVGIILIATPNMNAATRLASGHVSLSDLHSIVANHAAQKGLILISPSRLTSPYYLRTRRQPPKPEPQASKRNDNLLPPRWFPWEILRNIEQWPMANRLPACATNRGGRAHHTSGINERPMKRTLGERRKARAV